MKGLNTKITRRSAIGLLGAAIASPALMRKAYAAEVTLKLHHFLPPVASMHKRFFEPWVKEISEKSGGRIEVQIFPGMQLGGKPPQLVDQARKGIADITWTLPVYTPDRFPIAETASLPFMVTTAEKTSVAMHNLMDEFGSKEFDDVKPLAYHVHAGGKLHMREKGIKTVEDFKGQKVRAPNRSFGELLKAIGSEPVFFPVTEMAVSLANGVIDGTCLPYEVVPAFKLHELTKFHSAPEAGARGLYANTFALLMNKEKYEKLPDDLRKVIDDSSGIALSQRIGKAFDDFEAGGIGLIRKRGNTILEIPSAEVAKLRAASEAVYTGWQETLNKKGYDGKAVLAKLNQLLDAS